MTGNLGRRWPRATQLSEESLKVPLSILPRSGAGWWPALRPASRRPPRLRGLWSVVRGPPSIRSGPRGSCSPLPAPPSEGPRPAHLSSPCARAPGVSAWGTESSCVRVSVRGHRARPRGQQRGAPAPSRPPGAGPGAAGRRLPQHSACVLGTVIIVRGHSWVSAHPSQSLFSPPRP